MMMFSNPARNLLLLLTLSLLFPAGGKLTAPSTQTASLSVIKRNEVQIRAQPGNESHVSDVDHMGNLSQTITELQQRVNKLEVAHEIYRRNMKRATAAFFHISNIYKDGPDDKGRRYLLSKKYVDHRIHTAEGMCEIFGGYLAEITDIKQHSHVAQFVANFYGISAVYVGGTDAALEGRWIFQHSRKSVYKGWQRGQPNGGRSINCMTLYRDFKWLMADESCYSGRSDYRFLCEVLMP